MKLRVQLLTFLFSLLFLSSCGEDIIFADKVEFEQGSWTLNDDTDFSIIVKDTVNYFDILYLIRNNQDYPFYNLYLTYFLENEEGILLGKKLQEVHLMDAKTGAPFGRGFGGVYDHKILAIPNIKFSQAGKYRFSVKHYMRIDTLPGILSFGIQVNQKKME